MVDLARVHRSITVIGREDKVLQRCTLSTRSRPGDGQEHWRCPVLLPSYPSSGAKATNLLSWGDAPRGPHGEHSPLPVGHMSRLVVRVSAELFWYMYAILNQRHTDFQSEVIVCKFLRINHLCL